MLDQTKRLEDIRVELDFYDMIQQKSVEEHPYLTYYYIVRFVKVVIRRFK